MNSLDKKTLFTLAYSNDSISESNKLTHSDSILDHPEHSQEIIMLRIEEFKRRNPQYKNYDENEIIQTIEGFEFVYREVSQQEYQQKQIENLNIESQNEFNQIQQLLDIRMKEIDKLYPNMKFNLHNLNELPDEVKNYLFSLPLILTEDNQIMIWND